MKQNVIKTLCYLYVQQHCNDIENEYERNKFINPGLIEL